MHNSQRSLKTSLPDDAGRAAIVDRLVHRSAAVSPEVEAGARRILDEVRRGGDQAVREATARYEKRQLDRLELSRDEWDRAADEARPQVAAVLERAHARIRRFHEAEAEHVLGSGYAMPEEHLANGGRIFLAQALRPLHRVGLYAPGGTARYPSTVLMTAVPAKVAGVGELVLVTPGPSPETLHAARIAGVDRVFAIGGAQAVGALAYGTESVPRVDKIVGPGNAWVAAAKRLVFGEVDIDQVAGPSEVLVVAEAPADGELGRLAAWIAADLLAQAEHDADAYAVLATTSEALARAVADEVERQLAELPRRDIARRAIEHNGAAVVFATLAEARDFANRFAPEHLELHLHYDEPLDAARDFPDAGAIFLGSHTPEAVGDYYAGPNHVLPTGGSARFSSPLGVHDFVKRTSVLRYDAAALAAHADDIVRFADVEGLDAHGRAVAIRQQGDRRQGDQ